MRDEDVLRFIEEMGAPEPPDPKPNHQDPRKDFVPDPNDDKETTRLKRMLWARTRMLIEEQEALKGSSGAGKTPARDQYLYSEPFGPGLPGIAIADPDEILDAYKRAASFDKESKDRMHALLKKAFGSDLERVERTLSPVSDPGFLAVLDDEFPLFAEATASAMEQIGLFWRLQDETGEAQPFRLRPMLLAGAPGMGKTAYSRCLAELLSVPFHDIQMASATAGFVLSGTSPMWSNAKAGRIFDAVVSGKAANPIILLDELDKMSSDPRHRPEGPLYSLLERDSAAVFMDEYAGFPIDASYISWVATANDIKAIPEPILSRLDVFEVPEPTAEQARKTAISVYKRILRTEPWGALFEEEPGAEVVSILAGMSPREARIAIGRALGRACAAGRGHVEPEDLSRAEPKRLKAGFI